MSVDSTAVRAHQHAAGARKTPPAAIAQKGAAPGTNQVDPVLRKLLVRLEEVVKSANAWDVPAERPPPRSISSPTDDAGPIAFILTPGHYRDGPQFERVLEQITVPRIGAGRPRARPDHVLADKTPHAAVGSISCREESWCGRVEGGRFVELLVVGQAVVELAEHAVEQIAECRVVTVASGPPAVVVGMGAG